MADVPGKGRSEGREGKYVRGGDRGIAIGGGGAGPGPASAVRSEIGGRGAGSTQVGPGQRGRTEGLSNCRTEEPLEGRPMGVRIGRRGGRSPGQKVGVRGTRAAQRLKTNRRVAIPYPTLSGKWKTTLKHFCLGDHVPSETTYRQRLKPGQGL